MIYDVYLSVSVTPRPDEKGYAPPGQLSFSRSFRLEGERFSDIGVRVDALCDAVDTVLRPEGEGM